MPYTRKLYSWFGRLVYPPGPQIACGCRSNPEVKKSLDGLKEKADAAAEAARTRYALACSLQQSILDMDWSLLEVLAMQVVVLAYA